MRTAQLDAAVAAAYGWPSDITDDAALRKLLARKPSLIPQRKTGSHMVIKYEVPPFLQDTAVTREVYVRWASSQGAIACPPRQETVVAGHTCVRLQAGHSSRRDALRRSGLLHARAVGLVPPQRLGQPGGPAPRRQVQETIRPASNRRSCGSRIHGSWLPDLWLANERLQERSHHRGTPNVLRDIPVRSSLVFVIPPPQVCRRPAPR